MVWGQCVIDDRRLIEGSLATQAMSGRASGEISVRHAMKASCPFHSHA